MDGGVRKTRRACGARAGRGERGGGAPLRRRERGDLVPRRAEDTGVIPVVQHDGGAAHRRLEQLHVFAQHAQPRRTVEHPWRGHARHGALKAIHQAILPRAAVEGVDRHRKTDAAVAMIVARNTMLRRRHPRPRGPRLTGGAAIIAIVPLTLMAPVPWIPAAAGAVTPFPLPSFDAAVAHCGHRRHRCGSSSHLRHPWNRRADGCQFVRVCGE